MVCMRIRSEWIDLVDAILGFLDYVVKFRIYYAFAFVKTIVLVARLIQNLIHLLDFQIDVEI